MPNATAAWPPRPRSITPRTSTRTATRLVVVVPADAHERAEETYFVRHRSKWPAIIMVVLVTIFFVSAIFMVPMFNTH